MVRRKLKRRHLFDDDDKSVALQQQSQHDIESMEPEPTKPALLPCTTDNDDAVLDAIDEAKATIEQSLMNVRKALASAMEECSGLRRHGASKSLKSAIACTSDAMETVIPVQFQRLHQTFLDTQKALRLQHALELENHILANHPNRTPIPVLPEAKEHITYFGADDEVDKQHKDKKKSPDVRRESYPLRNRRKNHSRV